MTCPACGSTHTSPHVAIACVKGHGLRPIPITPPSAKPVKKT